MTAYYTFTTMKNFINRKKLPNANVLLKWVMAEADIMDTITLKFWPMDGPRNHVQIETSEEGNCGPRALAYLLLLGSGNTRNLCAFMKEDQFLQNDVLTRGCIRRTQNRPASYAYYSGFITPEITQLTPESMQTVYRHDVMVNFCDYNLYGIWQFHHAAEAFGHPIGSIYQQQTNPILRSDMNRMILPIKDLNDNKRPVHFMWSPLHETSKLHRVLHFVAAMVNNFTHNNMFNYSIAAWK